MFSKKKVKENVGTTNTKWTQACPQASQYQVEKHPSKQTTTT